MYAVSTTPTLYVLTRSGAFESIIGLQGVEPIEQNASATIGAALAQVVVTTTSETFSSQSIQPSATSSVQAATQNPIPGFPIGSIMLGLMAGFALLVARRGRFRRKSTS